MWEGRAQTRADACDIVVVGAGLTGAAVAAHLARERLDAAVLDAQAIAGGATGHSAGVVLTGLTGYYNAAIATYGRQKAQEIWALTVEGRERLVEAADLLGVQVEHTGTLALAVEDAEVDALRESAQLLREDGFDAWFGASDPLGRGFRAALQQPGDVTLDAVALTRALLSTSGVPVHERAQVCGLEPEKGGVRIWAARRTVLCNAVLLAVDGYAPLLSSYFTGKVAPTRGLTFASPPLNATVLKQPCFAGYGHEYCRQLPDRRLVLGSWHHPNESGDAVQERLMRFASRHFPEVDTHTVSRSSGPIGSAPDGLPLVGVLPDLPQVYFAVGLGGRGLAWAFVVAERLVELMLHDADPGLFSVSRRALRP